MNYKLKLDYVAFKKIALSLSCLIIIFFGFKSLIDRNELHYVPRELTKYLMFDDNYTVIRTRENFEELAAKLSYMNSVPYIFNIKKYGPVKEDTPYLLIQVHKDVKHLQHLIISLAQVDNIDLVLLIFSHSYYDNNINRLVKSIDFCKVMQIFYPHSRQMNPTLHDVEQHDDCDSETAEEKSLCLEHIAECIEHKQHWWWKVNFVFDQLPWSFVHKGVVVFLEENNYVTPDFVYMLRHAIQSLSYFLDVEVISLGRLYAKNLEYDLLMIDTWRPPFDKGLGFNRTVWQKIVTSAVHFCVYNDYSWSYSLLNLFNKFPKGHVNMVASVMPRVFTAGEFESGDHFAKTMWSRIRKANLYPKTVKAVFLFGPDGRIEQALKVPPGNGGWSDIRDQLLCLDPMMKTTVEQEDSESTDIILSTEQTHEYSKAFKNITS